MGSRKLQENILERISKINIEVIKYEKANAYVRLTGFQIFINFEKMRNFKKKLKNMKT